MARVKEVWKDIKGWKGYYQISSFGKVKSCARILTVTFQRGPRKGMTLLFHRKEKILVKRLNNKGYIVTAFFKKGKAVRLHVHHLIAEAFIPNPHHFDQINHKNRNKRDNKITNLEWCNNRGNCTHSIQRPKTSKYTGVLWDKRDKIWIAKIWINKKSVSLGYFKSEHGAAKAYRDALKKHNLTNKYAVCPD